MRRLFVVTSLALAASLVASAASAAPTYHIKELAPAPGGLASQVFAVNDDGVAVGWVQNDDTGVQSAAEWDAGGQLRVIGNLPGDVVAAALAVNPAGQVVGYSGFGRNPRAWIWDAAGGMRYLGAFDEGFPNSSALGISPDGTVIGHSVTPEGALHAFTWTAAGGMVDPAPDAWGSEALAINRRDQWTGGVLSDRGGETGVRVDTGGKATRIDALAAGQSHTYGNAINGRGVVAGSSVADDGNYRAFVWDRKHGMRNLGLLPGTKQSNALGINDEGRVVGNASGGRAGPIPFHVDGRAGMQPLSALIADDDPLKQRVTFSSVQGINNRGQIVVNGTTAATGSDGAQTRGYLLLPR